MKLYKHQQELVELSPEKCLLAWNCGCGKSLAIVSLINDKLPDKKVLVICPKSLKEQWTALLDKEAKFHHKIYTKEEFKKVAKELDKYDVICCDEAHYFAGMKSQMSKNLLSYIKKYKIVNIYLLTATPYMSTPWNVFVLARYLGKEWNYMSFKYKFFNEIRMGHRLIPVIKKGIEKDVASLIKSIGYTKKLSECIDVPDSIFLQEYFDLTKEQKDGIESIEDIMPIVRWTKIHQICGGFLKGNEYENGREYKAEKMNRLLDLCDEHSKVAVVCRYNAEIANLSLKLTKKKVFVINGATKDRDSVVNEINNTDKCVVLIQAACSEGYNLPTIPVMIFYSYDFSLKNYIQMCGRIQRINAVQKCVYISLTVRKTIDEDVYKCIMSKQDFNIAIYK